MNIGKLIDEISVQLSPSNRRDAKRKNPLSYQSLEQRKLLATFTVTTLLDSADGSTDGQISLREAIIAADTNAAFGDAPAGSALGDSVNFAPSLTGQQIDLSNGELQISEALNIIGNGTITINADEESRVFNINSADEVRFDNITITGGSVDGGGIQVTGGGLLRLSQVNFEDNGELVFSGINGGAINNQGSEITSLGSQFTGNTSSRGGAIYSEGGSLFLRNNLFTSNGADSNGGAIFISGGDHFIDRSNLVENFATDPIVAGRGTGGAIHIQDGAALTVRNSFLNENDAGFGGAINVEADSSLRTNSEFNDNQSIGSPNPNGTVGESGRGGAIQNFGDIVVFGGTYDGNRSDIGGAIYTAEGTAVVNNARFFSNVAAESGGAIAVADGVARILGTTIGGQGRAEGNLAFSSSLFADSGVGTGGGVALLGTANVRIVGGIIENNEALLGGGGVHVAESSRIQISGTAIENNQSGLLRFSDGIDSRGAGIYTEGTLLIDDASIATNFSDGFGAGIFVDGGYTRVSDSTITGNRANISGGGLAAAGGIVLLRDTAIGGADAEFGNFAGVAQGADPNGAGGGIFVSDDVIRLRVDGGVIANNAASLTGGGINASAGIVSLVNGVEVTNNRALRADGGGVYTDGVTSFAAVDAIFEGNTARDGAGLFNNEGRLFLSGSFVNNNDARRVAGGVYNRDFVGLTNTDISGNSALRDADFFEEA